MSARPGLFQTCGPVLVAGVVLALGLAVFGFLIDPVATAAAVIALLVALFVVEPWLASRVADHKRGAA